MALCDVYPPACHNPPRSSQGRAHHGTPRHHRTPRYHRGAADLSPELQRKILLLSKRIYRHLCLSGYARLDYRVTRDEECYLLEANPNPQIAKNEDFSDSAAHCGVGYPQLLHKIITLGLSYNTADYVLI